MSFASAWLAGALQHDEAAALKAMMPITERKVFIVLVLRVDFVVQIEEFVVAVKIGVLKQFVVVRF